MKINNGKFEENIFKLKSDDSETVVRAIQELVLLNDKRAIPVLIDKLSNKVDIKLMNALALGLGKLHADESVPLIMTLIKKPGLKNKRGSLVFALKNLDCKEYFLDFIDLICDGNYEVSSHALDIVESLVDEASFKDKLLAKEKLQNQEQVELLKSPTQYPEYDKIHFIRDALKSLEE